MPAEYGGLATRPRHESSEGRRALDEMETFHLAGVSDLQLILWSGCDADREPIVEVRYVKYRYPTGDEDEEEAAIRTVGWLDPREVRKLLDADDLTAGQIQGPNTDAREGR